MGCASPNTWCQRFKHHRAGSDVMVKMPPSTPPRSNQDMRLEGLSCKLQGVLHCLQDGAELDVLEANIREDIINEVDLRELSWCQED